MTPESIPGRLTPEDLEELLRLPHSEGPAYDHEPLLTDLPKAA